MDSAPARPRTSDMIPAVTTSSPMSITVSIPTRQTRDAALVFVPRLPGSGREKSKASVTHAVSTQTAAAAKKRSRRLGICAA